MSTETSPTAAPDTEQAPPAGAVPLDTETAPESVTPAQFDELKDSGQPASSDEVDLSVILDVPVTLALEVGRTTMKIRDLLRLNQGSVVELERNADQPMDLLVNGTLVATAEIVVVDESFGIRLIDVVSPSERIKNLRGGDSA